MRNGGTAPHTALIYADQRDRNRLVRLYLDRTKVRWNFLTILSAQPKSDIEFSRSLRRRRAGQRDRVLSSVVDVRQILTGANPATDILATVEQIYNEPNKRPLVIGDWTHESYGRFDVVLKVEEAEAGMNAGNLICCYRGEGFWSMDCKNIARAFELHNRILFGSATFEMKTEYGKPQ